MSPILPGNLPGFARKALGAATLAVLCAYGQRASAQNEAPFTIRQPPDGSTVREKVAVKVPLASIPQGGYVAYYIDGQFRVALAPSEEQRDKAKAGDTFDFIWDTKVPFRPKGSMKDVAVADGEHTIVTRLYVPTDKMGASVIKQTSSIKVAVQNKYPAPAGESIKLKYQYRDGDSKTYNRTGSTSIVAGLTQGAGGTEDQEMIAQNSELLVAIEDKYKDGDAIVRNLLKKLSVRQGGQETHYPSESLPKALYQELDPWGNVKYQNATHSFDEFTQLGIPVSATLELPILPAQSVAVGDKWQSRNVSLDLPGTAPDKQPKVTASSTLEGIEWQGGYPTAKIHQHYDGSQGLKLRTITVGNIEVMNPQIVFDQDVYVAYRSGTLVKVVRNLEITGKTLQSVGTTGPGGMGMPGGMSGGGGDAEGGAAMGGRSGMSMPGMPGMGGGMGSGGRGPRGGGMSMPGMGGGGMGSGGRGARGGGMSMPGMGGGGMGSGGRGGSKGGGMSMPGMPGMGGGYMGGAAGGGMGAATGQQPTQIKLKSITVTELQTPGAKTASLK